MEMVQASIYVCDNCRKVLLAKHRVQLDDRPIGATVDTLKMLDICVTCAATLTKAQMDVLVVTPQDSMDFKAKLKTESW